MNSTKYFKNECQSFSKKYQRREQLDTETKDRTEKLETKIPHIYQHKIFHRMLVNRIQLHIKRIICNDQV